MTGFRVDPDTVDAHARRVDALADRVRAAAAAGRPLELGAYGIVGQVFALAVVSAAGSGSTAVGQLATQAAEHAQRLRGVAADYRRAEHGAAAGLEGPR
jgi:hypothetical protein